MDVILWLRAKDADWGAGPQCEDAGVLGLGAPRSWQHLLAWPPSASKTLLPQSAPWASLSCFASSLLCTMMVTTLVRMNGHPFSFGWKGGLCSHPFSWEQLFGDLRSYLTTHIQTPETTTALALTVLPRKCMCFSFPFVLGCGQLTNSVVMFQGNSEGTQPSVTHVSILPHAPPPPGCPGTLTRVPGSICSDASPGSRVPRLPQSHRPSLAVGRLSKQYLNSSSA